MSSVFYKFTTQPQSFSWKVECLDGVEHEIFLQMTSTGRQPMQLFVDGKKIATVQVKKFSLVPKLEYHFSCGGDDLTLVLFGAKVDIVHRGILQHSKIEYQPEKTLPKWYQIMISLVNIGSLLIFVQADFQLPIIWLQLFLAIPMSLACVLLSWQFSTTPFCSAKKKVIFSIFITVWNWVLVSAIHFLLTNFDRF